MYNYYAVIKITPSESGPEGSSYKGNVSYHRFWWVKMDRKRYQFACIIKDEK
nr:hypothetical protein [Entomoplasma sp. MP1]